MYEYSAKCTKVVDGDTVDLVVDLGFNMYMTRRFRLYGINTAEMHARDPAERTRAQSAKAELEKLLIGPLTINTLKDSADKYGRYLATIHANGINVNEHLVKIGLADVYIPG